MTEITMPLKCAECGKTEVTEISDCVVSKVSFDWNEEKKRYIENYEDNENYGDLYLECANCGERYTDQQYDEWQLSNPITAGEKAEKTEENVLGDLLFFLNYNRKLVNDVVGNDKQYNFTVGNKEIVIRVIE